MSWWKRMTDMDPCPTLDRGRTETAAQRMVRDAPAIVPAPSPHADLAAAHIRVAGLEEDLAKALDDAHDHLADRRTAETAALEECTAHGLTMGNLRRQSAELARCREQRDAARVADDELIEKARALGDEVGQRIVTGVEARDMPIGTVMLRQDGRNRAPAVVKIEGGWWSTESPTADPIAGYLRFAVLYVPGTAETREVRPVGQRDRTVAVEGAAITLRAHHVSAVGDCMCGWRGWSDWGSTHALHVAEQLAAVGALGGVGRFTLTPGDKLPVRVYGTALDGTWAGHVVDGDGRPVVEIEPVVEQAKAAT